MLGGGFPLPPSPPAWAARVRRARPFRGAPRLRLSAVGFPCRARTPGDFVPPLLLIMSRAVGRGPMVAVSGCRSRTGLASLQRLQRHLVVLTARVLSVFGRSASCAIKVFGQVPCSAGSIRCLRRLVRRLRPASSCCAVAANCPFLPGFSGVGWVFVSSPPPPSVLPPSVVGRCEGSQDFVSPGSLCLSGGQVVL